MLELEISGNTYQFNFGMGFLREINKASVKTVEGISEEIGFNLAVARLYDRDVETLVNVLFTANKGQEPRITTSAIDAYIDDPKTDIEGLFNQVMDFLSTSNATCLKYKKTVEAIKEEEAKQKKA